MERRNGHERSTRELRVGYFGASTGGGAALVAAARIPERAGAVVSRGGRPDLAGSSLPHVKAPTLLIVGGHDHGVIELNDEAYRQLRCERRLELVPGATHLFEEPGALDQVAALARDWFLEHLPGGRSEIRNQKSEIRRKPETRNQKPETRRGVGCQVCVV